MVKNRLRVVCVTGYFLALIGCAFMVKPMDSETYAREVAAATGVLEIPALGLSTPVAASEEQERKLSVPEYIAGSFSRYPGKTLVMGHSSTVFRELARVALGDTIIYNGAEYQVIDMKTVAKEEISMNAVLAPAEEETLVLMTCAGEALGGRDFSERLIVTATASRR